MQELGQPPKELVGQGMEMGGLPPLVGQGMEMGGLPPLPGAQDQCTIS